MKALGKEDVKQLLQASRRSLSWSRAMVRNKTEQSEKFCGS